MNKAIDFYYSPTPNGWKVSIMLEECGLPYNTILIKEEEEETEAMKKRRARKKAKRKKGIEEVKKYHKLEEKEKK